MTVDAAGSIYVVDDDRRLHRVTPDGRAATLVKDLRAKNCRKPVILPNGFLALAAGETFYDDSAAAIVLVGLGLQPLLPQMPAAAAATAVAAPPPRSLPADLGALLDANGGDGSSDLTIRVGKRRFHVHRAILSARCDYFKQRLAGGAFADARAAELDLPDVDASAFAVFLRWVYTGAADITAKRARGVAELADRLLLSELCGAAAAVVAASVSPTTVVDCLLWAAGRCEVHGREDGGGASSGFGALLAQLKAWYAQHHEEVAAVAGDSRKRLALQAPDVMVELLDEVAAWQREAGAKHARLALLGKACS
ncbi:hypothetical protein CHLRE_12g532900v5 [Chlamydomonas reinhardtii]|uniref:Uncharacterized protein n=1 Tax=Chlamydomonas reinhardtii TaxID=3055 RepID=A8IVT1_CHLRE|nr:uncharacterized protein CHLRE_12g532900v5 [Chlamydomonas reinhardtii]PNW75592.1 hypothetical protein CHLRE_12g532900v5 [Chlamydomonas reinhardtii]|eukprot:XP_001693015.1 predicted protein [Chlamydomonas reinhardtii]